MSVCDKAWSTSRASAGVIVTEHRCVKTKAHRDTQCRCSCGVFSSNTAVVAPSNYAGNAARGWERHVARRRA